MRIAVPLFRERVSPHFGASSKILVLEANGTRVRRETVQDLEGRSPMEMVRSIIALGIECLICGGIQQQHKEWLVNKGITVVDNQKGPARDVVRSLLCSGH